MQSDLDAGACITNSPTLGLTGKFQKKKKEKKKEPKNKEREKGGGRKAKKKKKKKRGYTKFFKKKEGGRQRKGGSNPKGGVKRGKEQLESHTSPRPLSSPRKKRTKCNNKSPRAPLTPASSPRTSGLRDRLRAPAQLDGVRPAEGEHVRPTVRRRRKHKW